MQREMYFDNLEVVNHPHDKQEHANHEHIEALQPRLSLGGSPSSSLITTTVENTTLTDINTTLVDMNTTSTTPCVKSSGFLSTNISGPHNPINGGFLLTTSSDCPNATGCLNTTSSLDNTIENGSPNATACINTVTGFLNTNNTCIDNINGMLNTTTGPNSDILDSSIVNTSGFNASGFQEISGIVGSSAVQNSVSPLGLEALDSVGLKRKRDWMNSLTQPQFVDSGYMGMGPGHVSSKGKNGSSLHTSVRISNGSIIFPAGWEQYLDLQTGETYYVNWNTRTKHCKVQCPEVQRCLAGMHSTQENSHNTSGNMKPKPNYGTNTLNNKDTIEEWLSKLTTTTSALINNQSLQASKPPLPPTHSLKSGKQSNLGLNTNNLATNKPSISTKNSSSIDNTHLLTDTTIVPSITKLASTNNNPLYDNTTNNMTSSTHTMHSPSFSTSQTCGYPSTKYW